jgi:type IV pilus assembly protein PilV
MKRRLPNLREQRGATLIEVLVSLVILMFGLLGLVGVMIQSQRSQLESYQRVQALMLVQDMASRMSANKAVVPCYVLATYVGTSVTTTPLATSCAAGTADQRTRMAQDMSEWHSLLLGSSVTSGGANVGAVLGARGCVTNSGGNTYQVSVAWQGSSATTAPPAGVPCGQGTYGSDDAARRAVSITVELI